MSCLPCVKITEIPYSVLTITARKNGIFGRKIWLISNLGIAL